MRHAWMVTPSGCYTVHKRGWGVKTLMLNETSITDAGLAHLSGLTNLRGLDLRGTRVTEEGVAQLQRALPNCRIERTSGSDE